MALRTHHTPSPEGRGSKSLIMVSLTDKYPFAKFWDLFTRQNRCVSKWEDGRTDMEVFLRRTLRKWFINKFFQIEVEDWHRIEDKIVFTVKYVHIVEIRFGFMRANTIVIYYTHPHSDNLEEITMHHNDFIRLRIRENPTDFAILSKFYQHRIQEKPDPFQNVRHLLSTK